MNRLAGHYKCTYTRYADDMTLSTFQNRFPKDLAELKEIEGQQKCVPGARLLRVFRRNGFRLNNSKIRLSNTSQRQEVTGLTVNERVNVPRLFVREIRAMLHNLRRFGVHKCQERYELKYAHRRHRSPSSVIPPFLWVLRGKIDYVGMIRGIEDELYRKLLKRLDELAPGIVKVPVLRDEIEKLFDRLWVIEVETENEDHRQFNQGTAFMLRDVGLITASHVLGDSKAVTIRVRSSDGSQAYDASVVRRDRTLDLAILMADGLVADDGFEISQMAAKRNMPIELLGFPNHNYGDSGHFDQGIVSGFRRSPFSDATLFLISCPITTEFHAAMPITALSCLN